MNWLAKKLEMHKKMLAVSQTAAGESLDAAAGVQRHTAAIAAILRAAQYASYARTWWAQSSFEGRIANMLVAGSESYFSQGETERALEIINPLFKRIIRVEGAGLVRLSGSNV